MALEISTLENLRRQHPAWRLLLADSAPLIAAFLHRVFVAVNLRSMPQSQLAEALEDTLFELREQRGDAAWPRPALEYLKDWCANERGWLRRFYPTGSDEPHFELTPATEKAIAWLDGLTGRAFVGTESRLLTLFSLLQGMTAGSETDPEARLRELHRHRDELDGEIARVREGNISVLGETALRDRFQQFTALARELLADFREVEHNFRSLDRSVRERITLWEGGKGALLQEIMGERDLIAESDQGRSFRAFWDFLMSQSRQEELTALLDRVLALPAIAPLEPDGRLRRVHYDWLEAGEHAQRTVALLSQQLRRFLDDRVLLENRRIMQLLQGIEASALAIRDSAPPGTFMSLDDTAASLELPMERPLHAPAARPAIEMVAVEGGDEDLDATGLFTQFVVDKAALAGHVRQALQHRTQVTLGELLEERPLQQGLAELTAYLQLAADQGAAVVDEGEPDVAMWWTADGHCKRVRMPRVIFSR